LLTKTKKVIVIGSLNIDHILKVDSLPVKGETIISKNYSLSEGGKGANQAVAIGKMGINVEIIGKIGEDEFGRMLVKSLKEANVGIDGLAISKCDKTGAAFIMVNHTGNNTIVVAPGANYKLSIEDIKMRENQLLSADILVMQMEIPMDVVSYIVDWAKEKDKVIVLNYAPAVEITIEVLAKVDYLIMNEIEFQSITKEELRFENSEDSIKAIRKLYKNNLIVTLGDKGSIILDSKDEFAKISPYKVQAIDSTGAGDAFMGGFILGIIMGESVANSAKLGNASGAIAVKKIGAQPSFPDKEELSNFLKTFDFEKTWDFGEET